MRRRIAAAADRREMTRIWQECFGDTEEFIDFFFRTLYRDGHAVVVEEVGVVGAAYLIPLGDYVYPDGRRVPCAVTYALGVLPERQGEGIGGILSRETLTLAREMGYLPLICPAEPSLFAYYGERTDYRAVFSAEENEYPAAEGDAVRIDGTEYFRLREMILEGTAHIEYAQDIMDYQQMLCRMSGGGFFRAADSLTVCAAEGGDVPCAKELLGKDTAALAGAAARMLGAERICGRVQGKEKFAMAAGDVPADGWFGFAFD